jgi:hypothetical protein
VKTAWIALLGTLLGATVSYVFQRLNLSRSEVFTRAEQLRTSRIEAYSAYATALMDWRRSQLNRRITQLESRQPGDDESTTIAEENRTLRAAAWSAYFKVKLLCDDPQLEKLARSALETTRQIKHARDGTDANALGENVRDEVDKFLELAARQTVRIRPTSQRRRTNDRVET